MSLSKRMAAPDKAQLPSTWIERVGLPISYSIMVAQPLGLLVALLMLLEAHIPTVSAIPIGQIAIASLSLLWWARFVEHLSFERRWGKIIVPWLHILGWFLVMLLAISLHLLPLLKGQDILDVIVATILVTRFWRRGIYFARVGIDYGDMATSFNICLGCLLGLLLLTILIPQAQSLLTALEGILPLFFLSGIVSLSLARLSRIRATRAADGSQADPSRAWLLALTALGSLILVLVLIVNALFSFNSFEWLLSLMKPLWDALGVLVNWLLYGVIFLLTPLFNLVSFIFGLIMHTPTSQQQQSQNPPPVRSSFPHTQASPALPPELLSVGRWVLLALLIFLLLLVVRRSVQRWLRRDEETLIEEERETMSARSILRERWDEWWKQRNRHAPQSLEALDPTSIRARYRVLLQGLAATDATLSRHLEETPREYEERLVQHLQAQELYEQGDLIDSTSGEMLHTLTDVYSVERYGHARIDDLQRTRIAGWIPLLILYITGKPPRRGPLQNGGKPNAWGGKDLL
jgi:hypothetical protein